jgi:hypothetical protein
MRCHGHTDAASHRYKDGIVQVKTDFFMVAVLHSTRHVVRQV